MPPTELHHVQLAMPEGGERQAVAFYQGLLGVPEAPKPTHLQSRGGCWFESGAVRIHLGVEADFRPARKAHPALVVEDLAALRRSLEQAGGATNLCPDTPASTSSIRSAIASRSSSRRRRSAQ